MPAVYDPYGKVLIEQIAQDFIKRLETMPGEPLITPVDYLPQYRCHTCDAPLRYDPQDSHTTLCHCDRCNLHWRVTGLSYQADQSTGKNGQHAITLEQIA